MPPESDTPPRPYENAPSPYSAVDHYWPIQVEFNDAGNPVKLLIKDTWYSFAKPIYELYKWVSNRSGVADVSDLLSQFDVPEIPEFVVELDGVGLRIFALRVVVFAVRWAVDQAIELSKFKLTQGWMGTINIGWTPMGGILYREC